MTTPSNLAEILERLRSEADPHAQLEMRDRYGIHAAKSYGVPMRRLLQLAKSIGTSHDLAGQLWSEGSYEARTLAALIDDAGQVDRDQMQRWCDDFDNWAIVDTVCFRLFDRTGEAWSMVEEWVDDERLFVRRAGFALLWALALHDKKATDEQFVEALGHIARHASDPRPLVGKAITMALRATATKRPRLLHKVLDVARSLSESADVAERRVGRPILRSFAPPTSR